MAKPLTQIKSLIKTVRWLTRNGGLSRSITMLEESANRIEQQLAQLQRIERSRCMAFGHPMQVHPDDNVITEHLSQNGCFEPLETRLVQQVIKPGQTVIDVGANIGYYTLQFAKLVGPTGHVYAFEPDPENYKLLCRNVAQNGYANVTTIQKAVSNCSAQLKLFRNEENFGDHRIYDCDNGRPSVTVDTISLDQYVATIDRAIDVIKFDIQGAEAMAFEGMSKLLHDHTALQIITEFWPRGLKMSGTEPRKFLENLIEHGFQVKVIDEQSSSLQTLEIDKVLQRYPVEQDTDILFTNLYCNRMAA